MRDKREENKKRDIEAYYVISLPFLILGITTMNFAFLSIGFVFLLIAITEGKKREDQE